MYSAKNFILLLALVYRVTAAGPDNTGSGAPPTGSGAAAEPVASGLTSYLPGMPQFAVDAYNTAKSYIPENVRNHVDQHKVAYGGALAVGAAGLAAYKSGLLDKYLRGKSAEEPLPEGKIVNEAGEVVDEPKSNKALWIGLGIGGLLILVAVGLYFRSRSSN